jgi:hypothetical protein
MKVENFVATPADVVRFNKTQLGRAKTNLVNAQKRGDKRAVTNIQRKMSIYQYTIDMAQRYISEGEYINKQIAEAGD